MSHKKNWPNLFTAGPSKWSTTDPKYIDDVKEKFQNYYEKNIETPFEPEEPNRDCDCDRSDPDRCVRQEHFHGIDNRPCSKCGDRNCEGAPRFKGLCNKKDANGGMPWASPERLKVLAGIESKWEQAEFAEKRKPFMESSRGDIIHNYTDYDDINEFLDECLQTMRDKGHDYRQGNDDDLLHNFRTVAETVGTPIEKVWFTYFYKHYSAMATFIKEGGQQESEPIEGRIKDQIVYLLLFYRMVSEMKNRKV